MSWVCNHKQVLHSLFCPSFQSTEINYIGMCLHPWQEFFSVLSFIYCLRTCTCVYVVQYMQSAKENSILCYLSVGHWDWTLVLEAGVWMTGLGGLFVCLFEGFGHLCSYFLRLTFWMLNAGSKDGHVLVFNPNYKPFSRKAKLSCLSCLGDG